MKLKLTAGWFYGAVIIVLSVWILHSFLEALLAASVTAIASWPLYRWFTARLPRCLPRSAAPLIFTSLMSVFVLAPLMFAFGSLLTEANALLREIAAADKQGIAVPHWLENLPLAGPWAAGVWESHFAHPGAVRAWTQQTGATALLSVAQSLGQFMARHAFIIAFTILLAFFFYQEGELLTQELRRALRERIGERAERYIDLGTRAVRASVNSMLVVALFDGFASGAAYAIVGAPHAAVWGAITGFLALVPFLGYVAVIALTLQLAMAGAATAALLSLWVGSLILLFGDKILRPAVAREGTRLGFVWVLMGCLGGFEVLGLVGLVVGPAVLTLTRELWEQHVRNVAQPDVMTEPEDPSGSYLTPPPH